MTDEEFAQAQLERIPVAVTLPIKKWNGILDVLKAKSYQELVDKGILDCISGIVEQANRGANAVLEAQK